MSFVTPLGQDHDLLMVRATEIDDEELLGRIRENLAKRAPLSPVAAALGRARMSDKRQQILTSIKALQERVRDCGLVDSHRTGWIARLEIFIKKSIRKLFFRHLLQQHRVHLKLVKVLNQLTQYLEDQDHCMRVCLEESDRQCQDAAAALKRFCL